MNITLSADERLIERARAVAAARGTTLNDLVREYMRQLAGDLDPSAAAAEFVRLAQEANNQPDSGWKFDRNQAHQRRHPE